MQLTNLQKLDVSLCGLQELTQSVTELKSLTELNLQLNKGITSLPESLAQLTTLEQMNVSGCG